MRFVSYKENTNDSWGVLEGDTIHDLSNIAPSLKIAIATGQLPASMEMLCDATKTISLNSVSLLCPIPDPARILCVGQNYAAHRDEMGGDKTSYPLIFTRYPSSLVGHETNLIKPRESEQYDYEGELALIIGKPGRHIEKNDAFQHIAGYSCLMDGSARDYQVHTTQYIPGKNFDQSGSFGPWMLPADNIPEPNSGLYLRTRLNDMQVQETTTDLMIFDIPTVIAYLSSFTTLEPGDVIATGTPGGVGYKRQPQLFMKPGDRIEVEVEGIATLSNTISE